MLHPTSRYLAVVAALAVTLGLTTCAGALSPGGDGAGDGMPGGATSDTPVVPTDPSAAPADDADLDAIAAATVAFAPSVVGMTLAEAETAAAAKGISIRETRRDGEDLAVTMDYRANRLNVETSMGTVVSFTGAG